MRGCLRLQVKNKLYQIFGESPKTRIRCSAEVSMAFDRYTTRRTGTICQPEMQVEDGSAASCLSGISFGHYIVRHRPKIRCQVKNGSIASSLSGISLGHNIV